jgi:hypothetical protein
MASVLRFVPYLGAPLSAILPLTLAAAVGQDWGMVLWTAALFVVAELLTGQLVEPLVYGRTAALSPVAIILAAAFWAWLWGPLGLLISTPLTLCLVVTARHVDGLQFIDIMLGDQPALTPQQAAYQRMATRSKPSRTPMPSSRTCPPCNTMRRSCWARWRWPRMTRSVADSTTNGWTISSRR